MDWVSQKNNHYDDEFQKETNSTWNMETNSYEYKPKLFCPNWNDFELLCKQDIMKSVIKSTIKTELENNCHPDFYIQQKYNECMERKRKLKPWFFITICPKPDIKLKNFMTAVASLTQWKPFIKGYYVFEQRGEESSRLGDGFHTHIMLEEYNIEYKKLKRRLIDKFKHMVKPDEKGSYENVINVIRKKPEHARETLQEYMFGIKDKDKEKKCKMDVLWRQQKHIDKIYSWGVQKTDKEHPKKSTDGRVNNGGKRAGAGRPKTKTEPAPQVSSSMMEEWKKDWGEYVLEF